MESSLTQDEILLIIIIVLIFVIALLVKISLDIQAFSKDLRYINCEIERTDGAERRHWKREKKRLWLSFIFPFLRF